MLAWIAGAMLINGGIVKRLAGGFAVAMAIGVAGNLVAAPPSTAPASTAAASAGAAEQPTGPTSGESATCGDISANHPRVFGQVERFCEVGVPRKGTVLAAHGNGPQIHLAVSKSVADAMRQDRLAGEQALRNLHNAWRVARGGDGGTLYVKWGDVDVASARSTLMGDVEVTIR